MTIGPLELLIPVVLLVATTLPGWWIVGSLRGGRGDLGETSANRSTACEIFDERYARGEIGREEYQRVRQDLAD